MLSSFHLDLHISVDVSHIMPRCFNPFETPATETTAPLILKTVSKRFERGHSSLGSQGSREAVSCSETVRARAIGLIQRVRKSTNT